jgi:hypothetical protein
LRPFDALGCDLAEQVREQFTRYVAFHADYADAEADVLTLWTLHTHTFGAAEITPYLLISAPTPSAGKSRIIDVAQLLVRQAQVVVDPSPASLFRMIQFLGPTLFVDELDMLLKSPALRAVLNAGFQIGGRVSRANRNGGLDLFNVFCPKAFAGIAGERLPLNGATLSRCIEIPMQRRTPDEHVERFTQRRAGVTCEPIRRALSEWGKSTEPTLLDAEPAGIAELSDRQFDCWEPLLVIAERLGRDWPSRATSAALALSRRAVPQPDDGTMILADLRDVWAKLESDRAHTRVLAEMRNQLDDRRYSAPLSGHQLSTWLHRFGIAPMPNAFRLGGAQARGYERSAFEDAWRRYA